MRPIQLPQDELPHKNIIEWWYFHGHLQTKKKEKFSFMTCFFKIDLERSKVIKYVPNAFLRWFLPLIDGRIVHAHLVDLKNKKYLTHYHHMPGKIEFQQYEEIKKLGLHYKESELKEPHKFEYDLSLDSKDFGWSLNLKNKKTPLMQGPRNQGWLDFGVDKSYYYTLSNMDINGSIKIKGKTKKVTGKGWMDHQWGNFSGLGAGWTWLGIQLNDNTEYMLFKVKYNKQKKVYKLINASYPDGSQGTTYNYTLKPLEFWTSPVTKQKYGIKWELKFKDKKQVKLIIKSSLPNQEMHDQRMAPYYEGDCDVTGTIGRKKVKGKAFLEVVDYQLKWLEKFLHTEIKKKL
ncbi:lipocalin-like domain-containing protein [Nanoarchaeota archaeon]